MQLKFIPPRLFILLLLLAMIINQSNAQDIDRKKINITYIHLPLHNLPDDVATYYVNVKPKNSSWGNALGNIYDGETIKLNGYYRLPDASDADLVIESEIVNDLIFDKAEERRSELSYKRDKNSPEIRYIAYTYYTPKTSSASSQAVAPKSVGTTSTTKIL